MSFLAPQLAIVVAGIAVPLLVAMYFLKLRRRRLLVSSTLLWKKAIQDMQVNAPFQKLRRNLLLLLQLLILASLLFATARPILRATSQPSQRVVILLDHSASMNAIDVSGTGWTRLDEAKLAARELVDNLADGSNAMVVAFAERPRTLTRFVSDPRKLRAAIKLVSPTDQSGRLEPALRIIEPEALRSEASDGEPLVVYVVSDGRLHLPEAGTLSLRGADLRFVRIGTDHPDNLGIVSFSARRDLDKPQKVQLFARLLNDGAELVRANLTLLVDGSVAQVRPLRVEAGQSKSIQFSFVMPGSGLIELSHDREDDLSVDDSVSMLLAPSRRLRVLLVGEANAFIEHAVRAAGIRRLVRMTSKKFENQAPHHLVRGGWDAVDGGEAFDVIIFDGHTPQRVPMVNSLYFGAVPPIEGLAIKPSHVDSPASELLLDWSRMHPLTRYVSLDDVILSRPGRLTLPDQAKVLFIGREGPVMAELVHEGVHHVVSSFDILHTFWPMHVSFPVFVSNALQNLGLGAMADQAGIAYTTGQVAAVPVAGNLERVRYRGPLAMDKPVRMRKATLDAFVRTGIYVAVEGVDPPFDRLPVNLLDSLESSLCPADVLEVGTIVAEGQARSVAIHREVWPWFIWAALGILMLEWFVYTRRMYL